MDQKNTLMIIFSSEILHFFNFHHPPHLFMIKGSGSNTHREISWERSHKSSLNIQVIFVRTDRNLTSAGKANLVTKLRGIKKKLSRNMCLLFFL